MECCDAERLMDPWLDRELSADDARAVEEHLATCGRCHLKFAAMLALFRAPGDLAPPADLRDRVMAAVRASANREAGAMSLRTAGVSRPRGRFGPVWRPWSGAVAACVTFFVMGWVASRWMTPARPEPHAAPVVAANAPEIVLSPWLLSGVAQAYAMRGAANPVALAASAAAIEVLAGVDDVAVSDVRTPRRTTTRRSPAPVPDAAIPDLPVFSPSWRL